MEQLPNNSKQKANGILLVRRFEHSDYEEYQKWFNSIKNSAGCPSYEMLSTIGYIVEQDNLKICAGFLYLTNSNIAMIEFVIANKKAPTQIRKKALKKLLHSLEQEAILNKYDIILVLTSNLLYCETLKREFNYTRGKVPHYENVKLLWQQDY